MSFTIPLILLLGASFTSGPVEITPIVHASFLMKWDGKVIHVDPVSQGDYTGQPKADLILLTDIHGDHLDLGQIAALSREDTIIVAPLAVQQQVSQARVLKNGKSMDVLGIHIEAIPMYNLERGPSAGRVYHEKGRGNGYILTLGDQRIYISGDTACTPEMKAVRDIDVALVCMNLPYTMPPEEAAACVNAFRPKVVIPYHYRGSDLEAFRKGVDSGIEVQLLDWYPNQ
jgi:L-ascorbate metabolism protein UlaG (beta-lactamase superfamily)